MLTLWKDDAAAGRERLSYDPKNLAPPLMAGRKPQTAYKYDQLSESARHQEILNIYRVSRPSTRLYYEKGHIRKEIRPGEYVEESRVIDWFLWHTFSYRDNRSNSSGGQVGAVPILIVRLQTASSVTIVTP
jgi:hypothetical protein